MKKNNIITRAIIIVIVVFLFLTAGAGQSYCWDDGETHNGYGNPHRIGHRVSGDHICTRREYFTYKFFK